MISIRKLFKQSAVMWNQDNAPRLGASLAFYTLLSISPLVIIVIAIVSLVYSKSSAQGLLLSQVQSLIGPGGKDAVQTMLTSGQRHWTGAFSSILGVVTLLFGASGVFTELRSALNTIWKVEATPGASGVWSLIRDRIFSFGMVLSVGFVLFVSLLASAALAALTKFFSGLLPIAGIFWQALNFVVFFIGITLLFALIFKYVPDTRVEWKDVRIGAAVTSLLFSLGRLLLALYLGRTSPGSAYGAAGSLVVLIIWVYYSAQIFYFGAELTHEVALERRQPPADQPGEHNQAA